jgi:hypothetical protein
LGLEDWERRACLVNTEVLWFGNKMAPKAHVLKAWFSAGGAIERC